MWWLIPVAVGGTAWLISIALEEEVGVQRRRWNESHQKIEKSIEYHRSNIEKHLLEARKSYDFHLLTDLHFSSMKVADQAYKLKQDALVSQAAIRRSLHSIREKMNSIYKETKIKGINRQKRTQLHEDLQELKTLKNELLKDLKKISSEVNYFGRELKRLNIQTHNLKIAIRDRCGYKGLEWYKRLEQRKLYKKAIKNKM
ncbi:hypothetical protein D6779_08670 [Candidatus Parcubacteria bacterium]|nr:MAG: hypothetical protein D6779_08670 [Candidatus Parcubacteria bacterium]